MAIRHGTELVTRVFHFQAAGYCETCDLVCDKEVKLHLQNVPLFKSFHILVPSIDERPHRSQIKPFCCVS